MVTTLGDGHRVMVPTCSPGLLGQASCKMVEQRADICPICRSLCHTVYVCVYVCVCVCVCVVHVCEDM